MHGAYITGVETANKVRTNLQVDWGSYAVPSYMTQAATITVSASPRCMTAAAGCCRRSWLADWLVDGQQPFLLPTPLPCSQQLCVARQQHSGGQSDTRGAQPLPDCIKHLTRSVPWINVAPQTQVTVSFTDTATSVSAKIPDIINAFSTVTGMSPFFITVPSVSAIEVSGRRRLLATGAQVRATAGAAIAGRMTLSQFQPPALRRWLRAVSKQCALRCHCHA